MHFGSPIENEAYKFITFPDKICLNHNYLLTFAYQNILKGFKKRRKAQRFSKIELAVGDRVLLRVRHLSNALDKTTKKFFHLYEGPDIISSKVGNNAFVLVNVESGRVCGTYNRTNLRKYLTYEN